MEIHFKTDLALDVLAEKLRETLNSHGHNRTHAIASQKRYGVNRGGDYYLFEAFGLELNLLQNVGEATVPEQASCSYYLFAETEADVETVTCRTRQIFSVMQRTGLEMGMASLAS